MLFVDIIAQGLVIRCIGSLSNTSRCGMCFLIFCRYYCDYCDTHLTHDSVRFMNLVDC